MRLRVALDLGAGDVKTQLGGLQRGENGNVVGEDADLADRGASRELVDLALEDLPLRGEYLDRELVLFAGYCPASEAASPSSSSPGVAAAASATSPASAPSSS